METMTKWSVVCKVALLAGCGAPYEFSPPTPSTGGSGGGASATGGAGGLGTGGAMCTIRAWYLDADGDGFGDPDESVEACNAPEGYVADGTDCYDSSADVFPGQTEWFTHPYGSFTLGTFSYDYNCDGEHTIRFTEYVSCSPEHSPGWAGEIDKNWAGPPHIPDCGPENARWWNTCRGTVWRSQDCR